jgi:hypothetical protein
MWQPSFFRLFSITRAVVFVAGLVCIYTRPDPILDQARNEAVLTIGRSTIGRSLTRLLLFYRYQSSVRGFFR